MPSTPGGKPVLSKTYIHDMFNEIVSEGNLHKAYRKALSGESKYKPDALRFARDEMHNLEKLRLSLVNGTYKFDGYVEFTVYEPKERLINAPHFKDKIVQLAINNVLKKFYNSTFIHDSYACIDNKGTHKCVDRIQHFMKKANWEYGESTYIVKCDIKKFFYSINREILKDILSKRIKCEKTLRLLFLIIDSADMISELGLPLGNTLSQLCANIYMNELDQFCKREFGLHYYVRYMDDFIVVVRNKDIANMVLQTTKEFLKDKLCLELNEKKSKIFPINQGVNAIGFKIYTTHKLLRNDSKRKIKRKLNAMPYLISQGRMTIEKAEQMLNSWLGHAEYGDSHNFIKSLLAKHDFIYLIKKRNKNVIKINENKLNIIIQQYAIPA